MLAAEETALVLLAAGRSQRFGAVDKLAQPFLREPLAFHVVTALEAVRFQARIAVVSDTELDFAARGYRVVENDRHGSGQGHSLSLGVAAARAGGAKAVLIALADMPRVTAAHIYRLFDASDGPDTIVASSDGVQPRPPALFGAAQFDALCGLDSDEGGRQLIAKGHHVVTAPAELADIDTPEELAALKARIGVRG